MLRSLVGSEMCIRDRYQRRVRGANSRAMATAQTNYTDGSSNMAKFDNTEKNDCRSRNIIAAKAIADCVRTSLGPRGMDKMVIDAKQDVVITNDGATILKKLQVQSPAARMLVDLSKAQDIEAGDGTTTVVVIAGSLLESARDLLSKLHPTVISRSFRMAADKCVEVLDSMAKPIAEDDYDMMVKICSTSLNSKVISGHSNNLAPMAVDAVQAVTTPGTTYVDLDDIKVIKCYGGTIDDSERIDGIVFPKKASHFADGPTPVSYTHLRAHETPEHLVCRLLLEKKKKKKRKKKDMT
eukprot:TRINITY_DN164_c0_g1_i2.p1 TRINITY_DN164_c0_g1~~TRINITY_DN164_c0_g1_i2.p1  ORF type:complete len:344 (-),score=129.96 TRINITY_DN164_c0_g1_i2:81-968(-)